MTARNHRMDAVREAFARLTDIVATLRSENGCPWDRKQTPRSLTPYIVEEAYELVDAIETGDSDAVREELGDVLLQVVLQAQIAFEEARFDLADVAGDLCDKMIRRHPHVFGKVEADSVDQVLRNWEAIKSSEKEDRGIFDGLPAALPALLKAFRMGQKAGRKGFDWPDASGVRAKIDEELAELDAALCSEDPAAVQHELGDLLFAIAQLARHHDCDPEKALRASCDRFASRFGYVADRLQQDGKGMESCSLEELEALWQEAKRHE